MSHASGRRLGCEGWSARDQEVLDEKDTFGSFSKRTLRKAHRQEEGEGACPGFGSFSKRTSEQSSFEKRSKRGNCFDRITGYTGLLRRDSSNPVHFASFLKRRDAPSGVSPAARVDPAGAAPGPNALLEKEPKPVIPSRISNPQSCNPVKLPANPQLALERESCVLRYR